MFGRVRGQSGRNMLLSRLPPLTLTCRYVWFDLLSRPWGCARPTSRYRGRLHCGQVANALQPSGKPGMFAGEVTQTALARSIEGNRKDQVCPAGWPLHQRIGHTPQNDRPCHDCRQPRARGRWASARSRGVAFRAPILRYRRTYCAPRPQACGTSNRMHGAGDGVAASRRDCRGRRR